MSRDDRESAPQGWNLRDIPGVRDLQAVTLGDPAVRIAILDGPVDRTHASLASADLTLPAHVQNVCRPGAACWHGTAIASLIFGRLGTVVEGLAPHCAGLILPVLQSGLGPGGPGAEAGCSQLALAAAVDEAVAWHATIINLSAGQVEPSGRPHPILVGSVKRAIAEGILFIAAAGNDGARNVRIPAALDGVLVVGAHDRSGRALVSSNALDSCATRSVLAPGENLRAAASGGGTTVISGTSAATAIATGIAALLQSAGHRLRQPFVSSRVFQFLLDSRTPISQDQQAHSRAAAGCIQLVPLADGLRRSACKVTRMSSVPDVSEPRALVPESQPVQCVPATLVGKPGPAITAASCGCAECAAKAAAATQASSPQLVFALGQIGYDLQSEARRESLSQHMGKPPKNPADGPMLLDYLQGSPWEAASVLWTLNLDQTPIYGILPSGPFASHIYEQLRTAYREQLEGHVERVSLPGRLAGQARLLSGQVVPVVQPEMRGFYSWNTSALVAAVCGAKPEDQATPEEHAAHQEKTEGVRRFLDRVYYELRNLGLTSQDRAINYAAANAFQFERVYAESVKVDMELDEIHVVRSPVCRPESDCWDVVLAFFNPDKPQPAARRHYRFTVDVSDVVPVLVGPVRDWHSR